MMAQLEPYINFDDDYILEQYDETEEHYEKTEQDIRPWGFGEHVLEHPLQVVC